MRTIPWRRVAFAGADRCEPTASNPGSGDNDVHGAPETDSLGQGFVVRGTVRSAAGCAPLDGVRVQRRRPGRGRRRRRPDPGPAGRLSR